MQSIRNAAFALCLLGMPWIAIAGGADWSSLDPATRTLLEPWHASWDGSSAEGKQRLLANAGRWQAMPESARIAFLRGNAAWNAMSPPQRTQQRERFAAWRALAPAEQARVRAAATRFAALPVVAQQQLRAMFAALDADSQRSWLLGPANGGWIASVSPLFAYLPAAERAPTLAMLQALPADAHLPLLQLASRLPEAQRESLRRDLLSTAASARLQLLQQRLAQ